MIKIKTNNIKGLKILRKEFCYLTLILGLLFFGKTNHIQAQQFVLLDSINTGIKEGTVMWGDYNNDGYLDILLTGMSSTNICNNDTSLNNNKFGYCCYMKIFKNNGDETFTEEMGVNLGLGSEINSTWCDFNNDGLLDVLISVGYNDNDSVWQPDFKVFTKVFKNNGDGSFTEQTGTTLPSMYGNISWGDYNNDGYSDIFYLADSTKEGYMYPKSFYMFKNKGDNTFSEEIGNHISAYTVAYSDWVDFDNDGDIDISLTGSHGWTILRNNGDDTFPEEIGVSIDGVTLAFNWISLLDINTSWGDYNNDGFQDILFTAYKDTYYNHGPITRIYKNNGDGSFSEQTTISLTGVYKSNYAGFNSFFSFNNNKVSFWGDYNNDGNLDILISGKDSIGYITKIYKNNGDNTFTEQTDILLSGVEYGDAGWGDYNNDGKLDIMLIKNGYIKIYRNSIINENTAPLSPTNLSAVINGRDVTFSWDKSTDIQTPQSALTYNLVIGTKNKACDRLSPMSDLSSGRRRLIQTGNTGYNNSWTIKNLANGRYYWNVQAVDNAYIGGKFATEKYFDIPLDTTRFDISGKVLYDNVAETSLSNVKVFLINLENKIKDSIMTDVNGNYSFLNISKGYYSLTAISDNILSSVDPGDALLINRYYIGAYTFKSTLTELAADVTNDGSIDPGDALLINRYYIGAASKFPAGEWLFETINISLNTVNVIQNLKGICVGDTNSSYPAK